MTRTPTASHQWQFVNVAFTSPVPGMHTSAKRHTTRTGNEIGMPHRALSTQLHEPTVTIRAAIA